MKTLERVYRKVKGIERAFPNKHILFIPSESYCAATITIIQGLSALGFTIAVPYKRNINSWFCNEVVRDEDIPWLRDNVDFVLSNLHWGTRWDYYSRFGLMNHFKVLLDGDDTKSGNTWYKRYCGWVERYRSRPDDDVCALQQQPYRWMEPLGQYRPDLVFTAQKSPGEDAVYSPFGLQYEYLNQRANKVTNARHYKVSIIPGDGPKRIRLTNFAMTHQNRFPHPYHFKPVRGRWEVDPCIQHQCDHDPNVHSWHRWRLYREYFGLLNNSRVVVYPGVFDFPQWDSKRQWEAHACGCYVLYERPTVDMSSYPVTELSEDGIYDTHWEMLDKLAWLEKKPVHLDKRRCYQSAGVIKYFSPEILARRFLWHVKERMNE